MLIDVLCVFLAYLSGSLSTAVIVCRLLGLPDPRQQGSRNPGATNVLRLGGNKAAAVTLAGDCLKGLLPVLLAGAVGASAAGLAGSALGAFLGHLYPVFFGFQGGKGVATAFGVLLGLSWQAALAAVLTWLVVAIVSRYSSLAALTATGLSPFYLWWFQAPAVYLAALLLMAVLLIWRHHSNIRNLLAGTEGRIGAPKP
jgi:glycerol-3-phosphate acyltransferase PlsY